MVEQQILRTGHEGTASNNYRSGKLAFRRNATEVIINKYNIIGYRTANFTLLPIDGQSVLCFRLVCKHYENLQQIIC